MYNKLISNALMKNVKSDSKSKKTFVVNSRQFYPYCQHLATIIFRGTFYQSNEFGFHKNIYWAWVIA